MKYSLLYHSAALRTRAIVRLRLPPLFFLFVFLQNVDLIVYILSLPYLQTPQKYIAPSIIQVWLKPSLGLSQYCMGDLLDWMHANVQPPLDKVMLKGHKLFTVGNFIHKHRSMAVVINIQTNRRNHFGANYICWHHSCTVHLELVWQRYPQHSICIISVDLAIMRREITFLHVFLIWRGTPHAVRLLLASFHESVLEICKN